MVKLKENTETISIQRRKRTMPVTCQCQHDIINDCARLRVRPSVSTSEPKLPHREPITKGCASLRERTGKARSNGPGPWHLSQSLRRLSPDISPPSLSLRKSWPLALGLSQNIREHEEATPEDKSYRDPGSLADWRGQISSLWLRSTWHYGDFHPFLLR